MNSGAGNFEVSERPIIDSPEKAVQQLADIRDKKQEYFVCLTLDGANRLISKRIITIGTLTSNMVTSDGVIFANYKRAGEVETGTIEI